MPDLSAFMVFIYQGMSYSVNIRLKMAIILFINYHKLLKRV